MKRVRKTEPAWLVDRQLAFFFHAPDGIIPSGIERESPTTYSYDFFEGTHPRWGRSVARAHTLLRTCIWDEVDGSVDPSAYLEYIGLDIGEHLQDLTPVIMTHGDPTLENILFTQRRMIFIDPGWSRLECREIDEAKMLQSLLTFWETIKRGWAPKKHSIPFEVRTSHIALLASHWYRLMKHRERHDRVIIEYGERILEYLLDFLTSTRPGTADGHGWSSARLQEDCLFLLRSSLQRIGPLSDALLLRKKHLESKVDLSTER